jgi:hypothetical protein
MRFEIPAMQSVMSLILGNTFNCTGVGTGYKNTCVQSGTGGGTGGNMCDHNGTNGNGGVTCTNPGA